MCRRVIVTYLFGMYVEPLHADVTFNLRPMLTRDHLQLVDATLDVVAELADLRAHRDVAFAYEIAQICNSDDDDY